MYLRVKAVTLFIILSTVLAGAAHAGLLNTDSADPVEVKHVEVELNGSYAADKAQTGGVTSRSRTTNGDVTVTAGIVKGVDIAATLPYTFDTREKTNGTLTRDADGLNDMTLELKYQFYEHDGLKLAVKPGVILPAGKESEGLSDGKSGYTAALLATREFNDGKLALHANAGYERHNYKAAATRDSSRQDIFTFSVACEAEAAEGLRIAADTGLATNPDRASSTPPAYALVGVKYEFNKTLEGYAGVKIGLTKPEDDITGLFGITLKF